MIFERGLKHVERRVVPTKENVLCVFLQGDFKFAA
jgi:hypothetical protein